MATVKFLQNTNMAALPTSFLHSVERQSIYEFEVYNNYTNDDPYFTSLACLGTFDLFPGPDPSGTITDVMIDGTDFGFFPNLYITELSTL